MSSNLNKIERLQKNIDNGRVVVLYAKNRKGRNIISNYGSIFIPTMIKETVQFSSDKWWCLMVSGDSYSRWVNIFNDTHLEIQVI